MKEYLDLSKIQRDGYIDPNDDDVVNDNNKNYSWEQQGSGPTSCDGPVIEFCR